MIRRSPGLNRPLVLMILCYVALSVFSLLLLPARQVFQDLWYFGYPDGIFYPVVAMLRLVLFVILAVQISKNALGHGF